MSIRLYHVEYRLDRLDPEEVYAQEYEHDHRPESSTAGGHNFYNQYGDLIRSIPADVVESVEAYPVVALRGTVGRIAMWLLTRGR